MFLGIVGGNHICLACCDPFVMVRSVTSGNMRGLGDPPAHVSKGVRGVLKKGKPVSVLEAGKEIQEAGSRCEIPN